MLFEGIDLKAEILIVRADPRVTEKAALLDRIRNHDLCYGERKRDALR